MSWIEWIVTCVLFTVMCATGCAPVVAVLCLPLFVCCRRHVHWEALRAGGIVGHVLGVLAGGLAAIASAMPWASGDLDEHTMLLAPAWALVWALGGAYLGVAVQSCRVGDPVRAAMAQRGMAGGAMVGAVLAAAVCAVGLLAAGAQFLPLAFVVSVDVVCIAACAGALWARARLNPGQTFWNAAHESKQ